MSLGLLAFVFVRWFFSGNECSDDAISSSVASGLRCFSVPIRQKRKLDGTRTFEEFSGGGTCQSHDNVDC